jgi:tetratricopeptide (TPR) repeat protein
VSETKETQSGDEAQADSQSEAAEASVEATNDDASDAQAEGEASAAEAGEGSAPKKKKKKARESDEPENIRDRNARVRAEAAEKRRARREREQGGAPKRNLDASEVMDDALARSTHAAANFLTKHFNKVQWVIMAGLVGWIGYEVYTWRHNKSAEKATDAIFKALSAETGKVGADSADVAERGGPTDARRSFATDEERLKAAKAEYLAASGSVGDKASVLADLGAAGTAYDLGLYKDAQASFEKVTRHPAYATDRDIKGRTLEGLGMAIEAQKNEDQALKVFRELQNMDVANFSALGLYHQARILKGQGKNEEALKLLDKAGEKLVPLKETPAVIKYIGTQVVELMEILDPKKAKELSEKLMSTEALKRLADSKALGGLGGQNISPELQKRIQEMMEKQRNAPAAPMPGPVSPELPPGDAPAEGAPPSDAPPADAPPPGDAPAPAPSGAP